MDKGDTDTVRQREHSWRWLKKRQREGKGGNISAPNRWRGGDKQMKIGPAVLAQWNGWETGENRMTEGEMGLKERKRAKQRTW